MLKTLFGAGFAALLTVTTAAAQTDTVGGKITDPIPKSTEDVNALGKALTVEGRLGSGEECPVIRTKDGKIYGVEGNINSTDDGAYVRVTGNLDPSADFCLETKQVILVTKVEHISE